MSTTDDDLKILDSPWDNYYDFDMPVLGFESELIRGCVLGCLVSSLFWGLVYLVFGR
jgi:hypothetical protein